VLLYSIAKAVADYEYHDKDCFKRANRLAVL